MSTGFQEVGGIVAAPFTLKLHRGEGMTLLAMNWKNGRPPTDFVGFAIEFKEPGAATFRPVRNRLCFPGNEVPITPGQPAAQYDSTSAPIQKFRWVHFPFAAEKLGAFEYRVTPMFMDAAQILSGGVAQIASIVLARETYPGQVNIAFTRGYVASQFFVDHFGGAAGFGSLIPPTADEGLTFDPVPPHPRAADAYRWMGFEARARINALLDAAIADPGAKVSVVAYDLNLPELVTRFEMLGTRLRIIIDDSTTSKKDKVTGIAKITGKGTAHSAETMAATRIAAAGAQVVRQSMAKLQHNKMIIVDCATEQTVVCGSTNFSWRGFYVQSNNAVFLSGAAVVAMQTEAFDAYFTGTAASFRKAVPARWRRLPFSGIDGEISMSPHADDHFAKEGIAQDVRRSRSSVFYSLAFLHQTPGVIREALQDVTNDPDIFVYGMSDKPTALVIHQTDGNPMPVSAAALTKNIPEPFKAEAKGGGGNRMHHKFIVVDFDTPDARVYTGSFNFSVGADRDNGENLICFKDRRIATSYMVEALRTFDSYQFRLSRAKAAQAGGRKSLKLPPSISNDKAWWESSYTNPLKMRDRLLFA